MKKYNPSRLNRRLAFGHKVDTDTVNPNTGETLQKFVADYTVWGGRLSMTFNQQLSLAGTGITNAVVFVIRHNEHVEDSMLIQIDNELYQIDHIEFDDDIEVPGYDTVTCHREVTKHG